MIDFLMLLAYALTRLFRSRARLEAEILVLRHQLNILQRKSAERTVFKSIDRLVFAGLYRLVPGILDALQTGDGEACCSGRWPHRAQPAPRRFAPSIRPDLISDRDSERDCGLPIEFRRPRRAIR